MEKDPLRREIYDKAKRFEERVAELFRLQGFRTIVDYQRDAMQFDVRLEMTTGALPIFALVECKDTGQTVTQKQVRDLASKVETAREAEKLPYQPILVSRSGFANNAYAVAQTKFVRLLTFEQLLLSLVDLGPNVEAAIRGFQGAPLEHLYVEQDMVLESDIRAGEDLQPRKLTDTVLAWLDQPGHSFLTLLGDFGCGKTSFCRRLAWDCALRSKDKPGEARIPILIDLREGGSTTVTLESLLTHHFQRLSSQPLNPQALLHLNREGYLLLIFDGFDETIAYTEPGRYVENLRQILRAAEGKAKVLLTCRTHYFRDRPEALRRLGKAPEVVTTQGATRLYEEIQERPGTEVGYLLEFREEQISEYLQKALPPPADWRVFREQIRRTYNLNDLAERPFLLEIIVKTLPRLTERGGQVTLADLYETYCESWFSHTDFRLTLTREKKVALVEYLARLVWDSPQNRVHYGLLFEKATEFFKDRPLSIHDKERIDYEVRTALFLHRDAEGYYSFIHRSFLEFFIARTIRAGLAAGDSSCLALKRITREVVFFLEFWPEAPQISNLAKGVLETSYQARISENALFLLYLHVWSKLGSLVGAGADVDPDLADIQRVFSSMKPRSLHLQGADLIVAALPGIDLSGAQLEGAQLIGANLRQACLDRARLVRADLGFVNLSQGSAEKADLSDADLDHLDAFEASFRGAILRSADLSFARLTRADLSEADLDGIKTVGARILKVRPALGLEAPSDSLKLRFQVGHSSMVNFVAWSPDGQFVASGSADETIKIWDTASGRLLNTLEGHESPVFSVAWSPDGQRLASGSDDRTVRLWDAVGGRLINTFEGHEDWVRSVAWSPDGQRLASGSSDRTVRLWNATSERLIEKLEGHESGVQAVAWSPDGQRLASGSSDGTVRLWDAASGRPVSILTGHGNSVVTVAWSPDGQRLASGSSDQTVRLWDASSGKLINTLAGHGNSVVILAWSPDGQHLTSGSSDRTVRLWEAAGGRLINTLPVHDNSIVTGAWSPDGQRFASGSDDRTVRLWEASSGRLINSLEGHENWVLSVAWSPDGLRLASGSSDETVRLWDMANGRLIGALEGHEDWVRSVAWSPDGQYLASGSSDRTMRLWEASSGRLISTLERHGNWVNSVAWSPDGLLLASGSSDETVRLWDTANGRWIDTLEGHEDWVRSVAWSPDGQRLASGSDDWTVRLWDVAGERLIDTFAGHNNSVFSVAWSPDGQLLASGSDDKTVRLWDADGGRPINTLMGHDNSVIAVAWSPDGQRLASGSDDSTVRIWDPKSRKALQKLKVPFGITSLAWARDGQRLVLSFSKGFLEIWDLPSARPLIRLYQTPNGSGFAATPDGYVSGPPEALEYVRFGDGWALYDLTDVPERLSPERVEAALKGGMTEKTVRRRGKGAKGNGG